MFSLMISERSLRPVGRKGKLKVPMAWIKEAYSLTYWKDTPRAAGNINVDADPVY